MLFFHLQKRSLISFLQVLQLVSQIDISFEIMNSVLTQSTLIFYKIWSKIPFRSVRFIILGLNGQECDSVAYMNNGKARRCWPKWYFWRLHLHWLSIFQLQFGKNHAFLHHHFWPKSTHKMTIGFVFAVRYFLWPK